MNKTTDVNLKQTQKQIQTKVEQFVINMDLWKVKKRYALSLSISVLSPKQRKTLFNKFLTKEAVDRSSLNEYDLEEIYSEDIDDIARQLFRLFCKEGNMFRSYKREFAKVCNKEIRIDSEFVNLKPLSETYGLSKLEKRIISFFCCVSFEKNLEQFMDELEWLDTVKYLAKALRVNTGRILSAIDPSSTLMKSNVLEKGRRSGIEMDFDLANYIVGFTQVNSGIEDMYEVDDDCYPLDSYDLKDIEKTVMLGLIKKQTGSNILFRGEPGTGKTELAKTLSQHAKGKAYMMDSLSTCKPSMRLFTILRNIHLLKKGDLIIIDEAESILGELSDFRSSIDKGQINGFLDSVKEQNVIWIVNYLDNLDKSTIRRFDYNLAFGKPTDKQRKRTWENAISEFNLSGMVSKPEVDVLYKSYPLDFGSITSALMRYKSIVGERERNFKIGILIELLNSSMSLSNKKANSGNSLVPLSDNYDISILNTDCSIDQAVASVQSFYELEEKGDAGIKFLLHGLPGTGKTEFAKYMSATAERPLIVKNMSDLLDKYVGETEKHIAQSFKEAKDSNAILLLDEADGLFSKRVNARASWEVNQTNELLSQVENYPGVLICATNLLQNIDGAAIRRFQWKIKFSPLKPDKRLVLFNQYFPKLADNLSSIDEGKIKRLDGLTPGMLNIVKQKYIYLKDIQSATVILDELMREVSYQRETIDQKEFQIGFCG